MKQEIIYYPDKIEIGDGGRRRLLLVSKKPSRLFTLVTETNPDDPPKLPIDTSPRHVWLEDYGHDWTWQNGSLRYSSGVTGGQVWLLLEFDEEVSCE